MELWKGLFNTRPKTAGRKLGRTDLSTPRIRGGIGADEEFWLALERGEFRLSRCAGCGKWTWPAHFRCGQCGSWDMVWDNVAPTGTIYTWTRNHAVSDVIKERRGDLPYFTMLIELPQAGGIRIPGVLHGSDSGLRIGAPLRGVILPADERTRGYTTMAWELVGEAA